MVIDGDENAWRKERMGLRYDPSLIEGSASCAVLHPKRTIIKVQGMGRGRCVYALGGRSSGVILSSPEVSHSSLKGFLVVCSACLELSKKINRVGYWQP